MDNLTILSKKVEKTETKLNAVFMGQQILMDRQLQAQQAGTRKRNERFAAMLPAQQRVALAQEVISLLKTEKLTARVGTYLSFQNDADAEDAFIDDVFHEPGACTVCALGSVFICAAIKTESLQFGDFNLVDGDSQVSTNVESGDMRSFLGQYFSYNQLCLIEIAFEEAVGVDMICPTAAESEAGASALSFRHRAGYNDADFGKYVKDEEALIAIMKNIIKNKGTFKP